LTALTWIASPAPELLEGFTALIATGQYLFPITGEQKGAPPDHPGVTRYWPCTGKFRPSFVVDQRLLSPGAVSVTHSEISLETLQQIRAQSRSGHCFFFEGEAPHRAQDIGLCGPVLCVQFFVNAE